MIKAAANFHFIPSKQNGVGMVQKTFICIYYFPHKVLQYSKGFQFQRCVSIKDFIRFSCC